MKKLLLPLAMVIGTCFNSFFVCGQTESFDIATYVAPKGWQRIDSNGIVSFVDTKTNNGLTSFCQIYLYPSHKSMGMAAKDFSTAWNDLVTKPTATKKKPKTQTEKTPDGWTVVTGYSNITVRGVTFTCMLVTASGFGKTMPVLVNLAGGDYMAEVKSFFDSFELDSKATVSTGKTDNKNVSTENKNVPAENKTTVTTTGTGSLEDYSFEAPERWYRQPVKDYILLSQTQTAEWGCTLSIPPPIPSSGDLEKDAWSIFNQMYPGWQFRYTNEEKNTVSKGYTSQGLEYCMVEAPMQKQRPDGYYYDFEDGQVVVINLGKQIGVILGRHNRKEMVCFCKHQYEYWPKFFNSFTVKNVSAPKNNSEDISKRLVGTWSAQGGSALTKYIFAANGHYQFIGAYSTTSYISPTMVELKTSGFKGDGSYSLSNGQLTTRKNGEKPETVKFRMERVNHAGNGWTDRFYIRDFAVDDGKEYEVIYEKEK